MRVHNVHSSGVKIHINKGRNYCNYCNYCVETDKFGSTNMILHSALSVHTNRDMHSLFITIVLLYNYEKAMDIDNDYVLK